MLIFEQVNATIFLLKLNSFRDDRGRFTKINLPESYSDFKHIYISHNPLDSTLRGLHFQDPPFSERKIVLCVEGKVFDVAVSVRPNIEGEHDVFQVTIGPDEEYQGIVIPHGMAHGYQTLTSNSTLIYFVDQEYVPSHSCRIRWDDPKLGIRWPQVPSLISDADLNAPYIK